MKLFTSAAALFTAAAWIGFAATVPTHPATAISVSEDGSRKINLAGRQRMLSQRIAKDACFAAADIQRERHVDELAASTRLYDETLAALMSGDANQGMLPETNTAVIDTLKSVNFFWIDYKDAAVQLSGMVDKGTPGPLLDLLYTFSLPVLTKSDQVVSALEEKYGGNGLSTRLAADINRAGRQRMLSQKMAKEFCMLTSGYKVGESRGHLLGTVAVFESSHVRLKADLLLHDLTAQQRAAFDEQYDAIEDIWAGMKPVLDKAKFGRPATSDDISRIAEDNTRLLASLNRAVQLYEDLAQSPSN